MSDWNFGRVLRVGVAYVVSAFSGNWSIFASQVMRERGSVQRNKENRRAIQRYNEAQVDRLEMLDLQPDAPRTLVLGRVRYVEGVRRVWTSGVHAEKLTMIVSFAGHEIDAFEQWYLDDKLVTLDGSGWVQEAPYRSSASELQFATGTLNGSGAATLTLPATPLPSPAPTATWSVGSGQDQVQGTASVSVSGTTANVSGGQPGALVTVAYWITQSSTYVRIRPYLGTSGQNVGADLAAEYPGKITSTDRFAGIALAVVDVIFNPDVFPQGRPVVTAVMRGAKCLDPRTSTTAWTQNPALHALRYLTWSAGWNVSTVPSATLADVAAAADACDVVTVFTLRKPDGSTTTATLPRYASGATITADADHQQAMDSLVEAMAGRSGWAGGAWRVRAGTLKSTATTITEDWLVRETKGGTASDEPFISAVQSVPRDQRYNRITGKCVDPSQRYQLLPFPAVQDSVLVAAKGTRALEVAYEAVNHVAHAQHLASIAIREAQAGLRLELVCGEQAALLELFDVVAVTLPKYGYSAKTFEVIGWDAPQEGAYKVQLAEITAALFTPLAELRGRDPAPDSDLRAPWDVEQLAGLSVASGTAAVTDTGSVITRTEVTWTAAVGENIRAGGQIEVQYTEAATALPAGDWPSWMEQGTATRAVIPGLMSGRFYWFRVRAVQPPPVLVRGPWSSAVLHKIDGASQAQLQAALDDALAAAEAAQATADGKIDTFWQTSAPGAASEGDLWFDTDDGFKQYRRTGGAWELAADTRIGTAISNAATAQATADGKVRTFLATSPPTAEALGDLWLDTDDGNKLYRWSGSAWVAVPLGTGAIEPNAATELFEAYAAGPITRSNLG